MFQRGENTKQRTSMHVLNETNIRHYKSEAALVTTQDHMGKNRCPLNIGAK